MRRSSALLMFEIRTCFQLLIKSLLVGGGGAWWGWGLKVAESFTAEA